MPSRVVVERNRLTIKQVTPHEWAEMGELAHRVVFNEVRPAEMNRIDYALIAEIDGQLSGYLTAREFDQETVYWQYGGAFPGTHSSSKAVETYGAFVDWTLERYKFITTLVKNDNVRYLKLAMHFGFRIIGCRNFEGDVLLELLNKKGVK